MTNKTKYLDMSKIIIDKSQIPKPVVDQIENASKAKLGSIRINTNSPKDFLYAVAYYWFVMKFMVNEIGEVLNRSPQRIHDQLNYFDWCYSNNYEENKRKSIEVQNLRKKVLEEARAEVQNFDLSNSKYDLLVKALHFSQNDKLSTYKKYNFSSNEEFISVLFYLHRVELLSRQEIASIFGKSIHAIRKQIKNYDFGFSKSEGDVLKALREQDSSERIRRSALARYKN